MVGVETSLQEVQSDLLKLFFTDTILLGHSLESDLTALKVTVYNHVRLCIWYSIYCDAYHLFCYATLLSLQLIHSCVVDTAIVFPHRKGPPYKRALKTLMAEYMQKFIQDSIGKQ